MPSTGNGTRRVPTTETRPGRETVKLFSGLFLRGARPPGRRRSNAMIMIRSPPRSHLGSAATRPNRGRALWPASARTRQAS